MITLDELCQMNRSELGAVMRAGAPVDRAAIVGQQYLGVALQLPPPLPSLLWRTFRKTFIQEGEQIRGWNVRMKQTGIEGEAIPMTRRDGAPLSFGHYVLRTDAELGLTAGWPSRDVLDYSIAGNTWYDPGKFGYCPLVSLDGGELMLGWEVFRLVGVAVPLPTWFALRRQGPVDVVVPPPVLRAPST